MQKEKNKIELFNQLQCETKILVDSVLEMQNNIKTNKNTMNKLIKEIFLESNEHIEKCVIKWVLDNPIEAISYYIAKELKLKTVYYKNDNKYTELFGSDNIDKKASYNLTNINTLENIIINAEDICNHFSTLSCKEGSFLELDFLNNYKIELFKEAGHFCDDNNWSIEYKIVNSKSYGDCIYKVIKNNFTIN